MIFASFRPMSLLLAAACGAAWPLARAVDLNGLVDLRASTVSSERSWSHGGFGKLGEDGGSGVVLGQAILALQGDVSHSLAATVVFNADSQRRHRLDLQEATLAWTPLPTAAWKWTARVGAFFPEINQEIDYDRHEWTPTRTISASAINSWIGEELRIKGAELGLRHLGRLSGSPHDVGLTVAVFGGNDPAGTLLAWRGWGVGDRISGLSETIVLPDLPVYRAGGAIDKQTRATHFFREIDGRAGFYGKLDYSWASALAVSAMHYDNRGDPLVVKAGQYSWRTRFDHLGVRLTLPAQWELLAQWMSGNTVMGPHAVDVDYRAAYVLLAHPLGDGRLALRYDRFRTSADDILPSDPNDEHGNALALAYSRPLGARLSLVAELLSLQSRREARRQLSLAARQRSSSATVALRYEF
jgi:hypothetical protein